VSEQGLEGFVEPAGGDALEVQPRDQLVDLLGLAQVRWQQLAGKLLTPPKAGRRSWARGILTVIGPRPVTMVRSSA